MSAIRELLETIVVNARVIPDPAMLGAADVYAVPLDDIDRARKALVDLQSSS